MIDDLVSSFIWIVTPYLLFIVHCVSTTYKADIGTVGWVVQRTTYDATGNTSCTVRQLLAGCSCLLRDYEPEFKM